MATQKLIDRGEWKPKWEIAKLLGCHPRRIVAMAAKKKIGVLSIPGARKLYSLSDVMAVVEESYEPAQVGPAAKPIKPGTRPGGPFHVSANLSDSRI